MTINFIQAWCVWNMTRCTAWSYCIISQIKTNCSIFLLEWSYSYQLSNDIAITDSNDWYFLKWTSAIFFTQIHHDFSDNPIHELFYITAWCWLAHVIEPAISLQQTDLEAKIFKRTHYNIANFVDALLSLHSNISACWREFISFCQSENA